MSTYHYYAVEVLREEQEPALLCVDEDYDPYTGTTDYYYHWNYDNDDSEQPLLNSQDLAQRAANRALKQFQENKIEATLRVVRVTLTTEPVENNDAETP